MSLEIDTALREGAQRLTARSGLVLLAVFLVFTFVNTVVAQSFFEAFLQTMEAELASEFQPSENPFTQLQSDNPLAVPLPVGVAALLMVALAVLAEFVRIVAIRVFASDHTGTIPGELVTRRSALATINGIVGGIVVGVLVTIGAVFLLIPGLFLALSFFFVRQEIAVEDKNFVDAMADSWQLSKGNRWELLGLVIIVFVIGLLVEIPGFAVSFVAPLPGAVVSSLTSGLITVFGIAVATRAYEQVRAERAERFGVDEFDDGDPGESDEYQTGI